MKKKQSGISLFIVMIVVLLSAILVAMSFRSSVFNEYVVGNSAEYQRVYEAAQSLISDAELDIQGITSSGTSCTSGCRVYGTTSANASFFPEQTEYTDVLASLNAAPEKCIKGICMPQNETAGFWSDPTKLASMKQVAAHYGEFTGGLAADQGNSRLKSGQAWYWVELLPYAESSSFFSSASRHFEPAAAPVLYRITAIAQGNKNTRAVIQKVVVLKKV